MFTATKLALVALLPLLARAQTAKLIHPGTDTTQVRIIRVGYTSHSPPIRTVCRCRQRGRQCADGHRVLRAARRCARQLAFRKWRQPLREACRDELVSAGDGRNTDGADIRAAVSTLAQTRTTTARPRSSLATLALPPSSTLHYLRTRFDADIKFCSWFYTSDNRLAITNGNQCLDRTGGSGAPQTYQV
jgi:hypothetical protein